MTFTSYCRLCAKCIAEVDLIDIHGNRNGLEMKIKQCFQFELDNDNVSPKQACILCVSKVQLFHDFVIQVQKAQLVFKSNTNFVETKVEVNNADLDDFKYDLNNTNSDKFSDYDDNYEENGSDDDYEPEPEPTEIKSKSKQSKKNGLQFKKEDETETEEDIEAMKTAFYKKVNEMSAKKFSHLITDEMYGRLIREVEESEAKTKKITDDYKRLNRFEVLITDDNCKKLIVRRNKPTDPIKYFVPKSEMFTLLREAHLQLNHGGRCRVEALLRSKYKNLSTDLTMMYLNLCKVCKNRKKPPYERDQAKSKEVKQPASTPARLKCNVCNKMFHTSNEITDHFESVHKQPVEFICLECSKIFYNYIKYRNHLLSHKNKYRYRCEQCDKCFSSNRKLQDHKQRHLKVRKKKHFCSVCGKGFLERSYLTKHEKRIHLIGDISPEQLIKHECDICHKSFSSMSNMNNHRKIHSGIREHTCEHCGKSFFYKKCLEHHITTHSDERPFTCEQCPARFKTKMLLRQHVLVHTGATPFQCYICGKKFKRKPALISHSITHTNLYPFKCEICDKRFRSKKNCLFHQRLHTGEKPYSCEMCNRHFACSSYYDKHMKRNHGVVKVKKEFSSC